MGTAQRPLAVVTGASSGIGRELARLCARHGYDLLIAADEPAIESVAEELRKAGVRVDAVEVDLGTREGVSELYARVTEARRPVSVLMANAGHGLGHAFLDQDFDKVVALVNTNIIGTISLIQKIGRDMRAQGDGRMLITGSIAGLAPGPFQAVYNASKAFVDSFAAALRNELKDTGVSVTCLMPGVTDTGFFKRADLMDTQLAQGAKADPADVAKTGFDAMMRGADHVVHGWRNKVRAVIDAVAPTSLLAEQHRKTTAPGTAEH